MKSIIKRRPAAAGAFWPGAPRLPSGEPALHEPRSLYSEIGQFLIRHAIQELVDLGPCCLRAERAQRHRLRRLGLLKHWLRRGSSACRFGGWRRCPEQVPLSLIANQVSRHATSSLISLR